jgi:hypothetical protein
MRHDSHTCHLNKYVMTVTHVTWTNGHDIAVTHVTWTNASWLSHEQMNYDITVTHGTWTYVSQQSQINVMWTNGAGLAHVTWTNGSWVTHVIATWTNGSWQSCMSHEQLSHASHTCLMNKCAMTVTQVTSTECLPSTLTLLIYRFSKDWISWEFWNMVNCAGLGSEDQCSSWGLWNAIDYW